MGITRLFQKMTTGFSEAKEKEVSITPEMTGITVIHKGENIRIKRDPRPDARIPELFSQVSRPCPPFCVQPMKAAENVETIGELELLDYLKQLTDERVVVVDSRLKNWVNKGTIPGSINIPWTSLVSSEGATLKNKLSTVIRHFSAELLEGKTVDDVKDALSKNQMEQVLDYSNAKILVLFCNGTWCGQTSESIKALLKFGYPPEKIKYYRDGMQGWVSLGLTTVYDNETCKILK